MPVPSHGLVLGIDASNIRSGGGLTHLAQVLGASAPHESGFRRVVVWADAHTLAALPEAEWLVKAHEPALGRSSTGRALWRETQLPRRLRDAGAHVLLAPGGTLPRRLACPAVTMSQNLLPFDRREAARMGLATSLFRHRILRWLQGASFLRASGVIFLTHYARRFVAQQLEGPLPPVTVIPHGVEARFRREPAEQRPIAAYSPEKPFRFLYVSVVHLYKHQWHVAEAVGRLRAEGLPVAVDFVGPAWRPALHKLQRTINAWDPERRYIRYRGPVPFDQLHTCYHGADAFIFASTCENMPNILLEAQAAGLPIACSNKEPMLGMLGDGGAYFDPEDPESVEHALLWLLADPGRRLRCARIAHHRAQVYSWPRCARETLNFVASVAAA